MRSQQFPLLFCAITLQFISGLANDLSSPKDASSSSIVPKVIVICLGVVAVIAFSVFLFKIWEKKKREEQHARLLKLFEDDDELEVELGIRD